MRRRGGFAALCVAVLCMLVVPAAVRAETATVTIGVGDTVLSVSGRTSPNAFVTISKDGAVIGTTSAASDGTFAQTYPAQEPGIHQLAVFAHASGGQNTDTVSLNVNIAEHGTTNVAVFLPPTVVIGGTDLAVGQKLELNGEGAPGTTVTIYIDNTTYATTNTNEEGVWSIALDTASLAAGQHSLFVRATTGLGEQSYPSASRSFSVAVKPGAGRTAPPPATPDTPGETPGEQAAGDGLIIRTPQTSFAGYTQRRVWLRALVENGRSPYHAHLNWGDGSALETRLYEQKALLMPHIFTAPGTYTVRMEVRDADGREGEAQFTVEVEQPPANAPFDIRIPLIAFTILCLGLGVVLLLRPRFKPGGN